VTVTIEIVTIDDRTRVIVVGLPIEVEAPDRADALVIAAHALAAFLDEHGG